MWLVTREREGDGTVTWLRMRGRLMLSYEAVEGVAKIKKVGMGPVTRQEMRDSLASSREVAGEA